MLHERPSVISSPDERESHDSAMLSVYGTHTEQVVDTGVGVTHIDAQGSDRPQFYQVELLDE